MRTAEIAASAFALLFVNLCYYRTAHFGASCCDAGNYRALADIMTRVGVFSGEAFSPLRTYGYPLFLSLLPRAAGLGAPVELAAAEVQAALYLASAYLLKTELARYSKRLGSFAFVGLALNIFALIYCAETLTESLSFTAVLLSAVCWLWSVRVFRSRRYPIALAAGSIVCGFAVMVRPANLFLPLCWAGGQVWLLARRRTSARLLAAAALVLGLLLPLVPQFYINVKYANRRTPLVAVDLTGFQMNSGVAMLRFAASVRPNGPQAIVYGNPFSRSKRPSTSAPLVWYFEHPAEGLTTILCHWFSLLDRDLIFPYNIDITAPYLAGTSVLNHTILGVALYALVIFAAKARRRSTFVAPLMRVSAIPLALCIFGLLAVYATTAVESRFGLPLMVIAGALVPAGAVQLLDRSLKHRMRVAAAIGGYVVAALFLSSWTRAQAPALVAADRSRAQGRTNLALFKPARQSSSYGSYTADRGVDGQKSDAAGYREFLGFHTARQPGPWWDVDLQTIQRIGEVRVYNAPPYERAYNVRLLVSDDGQHWAVVYENQGRPFGSGDKPLVVSLNPPRNARFVRVDLPGDTWLHLEEVEVFSDPPPVR